ncbi:NUDIX hydrolase [Halopenitus sp. H-Gu1]|uniref:NUDIX hydrolase n=1 Tax=Halopenitus sp. H-Gu1 TaxID=3242697 RepID=UPI00359EA528
MEELSWETIGTDIDYTCPGFDVRRDEVRFPDGTDGEYHYIEEPPAVVVLPFTPEDDVVVIDEWRQAVGRVNRGLPAGTIESTDEGDVEAAAARELAEETGYVADSFERLIDVEPSNGITNSRHHHVLARGCEPTADRNLDGNESIAVDVVAYDDLLADVVDGTIVDGRTAMAVLYHELTSR